MGFLFSMIPLPYRVGVAVALMAALGAAFWWYGHQQWQQGYARAHIECVAEQQRIEQANRDAAQRAAERLMKQADALSLKSLEYDNALEQLDKDAAADPRAAECGVGSDSVRRLNQTGR